LASKLSLDVTLGDVLFDSLE